MKIGDMCIVGGRKGKVLGLGPNEVKVGVGEPHYFNYHEKEFARHEVTRFVPADDAEVEKAHESQLKEIVAYLEKALDRVLPGEKFHVRDGVVWGACESVSIEPVVVETKRIGETREVAGWSVGIVTYSAGTRWEPPDCDVNEVGEFSSWRQAAGKFIESVFQLRLADTDQAIADDEYAKSFEELS
jgi:hypothetical protein